MIYTSFYNNKNLIKITNRMDLDLVSISNTRPGFYNGYNFSEIKVYKPLVPDFDIVKKLKNDSLSPKDYTKIYLNQINKYRPEDIFNELIQTILLCWCAPKAFCHRHVFSDWCKKNRIVVEELDYK